MRHLEGMTDIQLYEFMGEDLAAVLSETALFVAANPDNSWDLKQECHEGADEQNVFIIYLYATPF